MTLCTKCGIEVALPYKCKYCGSYFCPNHRLPKNHGCLGFLRGCWPSAENQAQPIKKVRLRNGKIVDFDRNRIKKDILRRVKDQKIAEKLTEDVIRILEQKYAGKVLTLKNIRIAVESVLINHKKQLITTELRQLESKTKHKSWDAYQKFLRLSKKLRITEIVKGTIISFFSLALLIFGILLVGTKIGLFSIPWIEGWGTIFVWFLPVELLIVLAGIIGIIAVLGTIGKGWISILIAFIALCLIVAIIFPNATKILFWRGEEGEFMEAYVKSDLYIPFVAEGYVVGGDGHKIWLHNNPKAKNPTYNELLKFLEQDKTDQKPYLPGAFVCADFAEMLHNNAEKAGIRCAFVLVEFSDLAEGHSLNAFKTVDKGLVFVDCTGDDTIVVLEIGKPYSRISLFQGFIYKPLGTIKSYRIQW